MRNPKCFFGFLALGLCTGCPTNIQKLAAFKASTVAPPVASAHVGDVVSFRVVSDVPQGSRWLLSTYPPVRFAKDRTSSYYDWLADGKPIDLEAILAPWDRRFRIGDPERSWLWFGLMDEGEPQPLDRALPFRPLPFRELGPVSFASGFSLAQKGEPRITSTARNGRVYVTYKTPADKGTPHAPYVRPMLLETDGRKMLYVEVFVDFGETGNQPIGYAITLSYADSVGGPVEVVLAEWIGHGWWEPFNVLHGTVPAPSGDAEAAPASSSPPKDPEPAPR